MVPTVPQQICQTFWTKITNHWAGVPDCWLHSHMWSHFCCPLQKLRNSSGFSFSRLPRLRSFQQELCHQILQNGIHLLLDILLMLLSHFSAPPSSAKLPRLKQPRPLRRTANGSTAVRRLGVTLKWRDAVFFFDQKWWSENHGWKSEITFRLGF